LTDATSSLSIFSHHLPILARVQGRGSNSVVAAAVRRLREQQGWSQEDFAARCGLHRTYVGAVERGERNITLNTLDRIAKALKVEPVALLVRLHV
jgi:DNA-binding XRE family transcriptional regulator